MQSAGRKEIATLFFLILALALFSFAVFGTPVGPTITYVENGSSAIKAATPRSQDERGTIITVRMNVTQQSLYWKAYVGNVSGLITLDDSNNYTIYDWTLSTIEGEVYATRKSTTADWASIVCAQTSQVETEANTLNHSADKSDNLNSTFGRNNHTQFYVGNVQFTASVCNYTLYPYVNDSTQNSDFVEVLLYDGSDIIYTTILNNSITGYSEQPYDFQMLVGEKGQEGSVTPSTYYFYVELT